MSQNCSHCGGSGSIAIGRAQNEPTKHMPTSPGMVKCPICVGSGKTGIDVGSSAAAGESIGWAIGGVVVWALNNRYLAYYWFFQGCIATSLLVALMIWGDQKSAPDWYGFSVLGLTLLAMVVLRKKMVSLGKMATKVLLLTLAIFIGISLLG